MSIITGQFCDETIGFLKRGMNTPERAFFLAFGSAGLVTTVALAALGAAVLNPVGVVVAGTLFAGCIVGAAIDARPLAYMMGLSFATQVIAGLFVVESLYTLADRTIACIINY